MTALLAAQTFKSNAHMIAQCAQMGYLHEDWFTLDPTYGKGNFWKQFRPTVLSMHDKYLLDGVDYTKWLPEEFDTYDAAVFDPPYVAKGGRKTSGMVAFDHAYGLRLAPKSPALMQSDINLGLDALAYVVKPNGFILVKCQNYVSSGKLWLGREWTLRHAMDNGFGVEDIIEYIVKAPRPQPKRTHKGPNGERVPSNQKHFQRNISTLLVLRSPK